jgi:hypothetical protein
MTSVAVLADEACFWRSGESSNPDTEILTAARPSLATTNERCGGCLGDGIQGNVCEELQPEARLPAGWDCVMLHPYKTNEPWVRYRWTDLRVHPMTFVGWELRFSEKPREGRWLDITSG